MKGRFDLFKTCAPDSLGDRRRHAGQTLCPAAVRSCASFQRKMPLRADQKARTASHTRSNQNPENVVAQSIPASDSWPPVSLGPQRASDCMTTTGLPSRDEALSFHSGVLNGYSGNCRAVRRRRKMHRETEHSLLALIWVVCRAAYICGQFFC